MGKEYSLQELEKRILRCNRCGTCQDVCPTYRITGDENDVARSRVRLARLVLEGKYQWGEEEQLTANLNACLLCKACVAVCPANVPTDEIVMEARKYTQQRKGLPPFNRIAYRGVFSHNKRLALLTRVIRMYQKSGMNRVVQRSGFLKLLKDWGKAEDLLPPMPAQSLGQMLPDLLRPPASTTLRVVFFAGCAINFFYSRIGAASIRVLQANACQVAVPEVGCCGGPHQSGGDFSEAMRLAKGNIDRVLAQRPDVIVSDCATCSSVLKEYAALLGNDAEYGPRSAEFSAKVRDINELIVEKGWLRDLAPLAGRVSYHDPCHLARGQGITAAPRTILRSIPGLEMVEMREADMCCGGAGSYGALHPDMSRRILDRKMGNFKGTGATILATSCPSCAMQLEYGIRRHGLTASVMHPMELLALSCEKGRAPGAAAQTSGER